MTHPPLTLKRWRPLEAAMNRPAEHSTATFETEPPIDTLLVDLDPTMANQRNLVTLHRAAEINGLLDSLFEPNAATATHPWQRKLPRIVGMDTEAFIDGEKMTFTWTGDAALKSVKVQEMVAVLHGGDNETIRNWATGEIADNTVAESIAVRILVQSSHGAEARQLRSDFGVGSEFETRLDEAGIIVTRDGDLDIEALKSLIAEAVFEDDPDDNDSAATQLRKVRYHAHAVAAKLLLKEREAAAENLRHAIATHAWHLLPDDRTVQIRKKPARPDGHGDVEVVILHEDPT